MLQKAGEVRKATVVFDPRDPKLIVESRLRCIDAQIAYCEAYQLIQSS